MEMVNKKEAFRTVRKCLFVNSVHLILWCCGAFVCFCCCSFGLGFLFVFCLFGCLFCFSPGVVFLD